MRYLILFDHYYYFIFNSSQGLPKSYSILHNHNELKLAILSF